MRVGQYQLLDRIGEGGMGAVYRGEDTMLQRQVAIKVLRPELAQQKALVERFRTEAVALARLNHPNIAAVYGLLQEAGQYYMVLEYVDGSTLEDLLHRRGRLPWVEAVQIAKDTLAALDHAHRMGVIHRDLKPANLMVTRGGQLKVMDFGIARLAGTSRHTEYGRIVGTPLYMSPEQLRGEEVDGRSDVYSLGVVLYELLTGREAFQADSDYALLMAQLNTTPEPVGRLVPGLPPDLETVLDRALMKARDHRWTSATEFRRALARVAPDPVTRSTAEIPTPAGPTRIEAPAMAPGPTADVAPTPPTRIADADPTPPARVAESGANPPTRDPGVGPTPPTRIADPGPTPPTQIADAGPTPPTRIADAGATPPTRIADAGPTPPTRVADAGPLQGDRAVSHGPAPATRWADQASSPAKTPRPFPLKALGLAAAVLIVAAAGWAATRPGPIAPPPAEVPNPGPSPTPGPVAPPVDRPPSAPSGPEVIAVRPSPPAPPPTNFGEVVDPRRQAPSQPSAPPPSPRETEPKPKQPPTKPVPPPAPPPPAPTPTPTPPPSEPAGPAERPADLAAAAPAFRAGIRQVAEWLKSRDVDQVERSFGGDASQKAALIKLVKQFPVELEKEELTGSAAAAGGRATAEYSATLKWRSSFGGTRRTSVRISASYVPDGSGWRLRTWRFLGNPDLD